MRTDFGLLMSFDRIVFLKTIRGEDNSESGQITGLPEIIEGVAPETEWMIEW